jgi:hypothetical protein
MNTTFRWINDPKIAVPFLFYRKVSKKDHLAWYNSIKSDRTQFLFAILDKIPLFLELIDLFIARFRMYFKKSMCVFL